MMRRSLGPGVALVASSFILAAPAWAQGGAAPTGPAAPPPAAAAPAAPAAQPAASTGTQSGWNAQADTGAKPAKPPVKKKARAEKLKWRNSYFTWDQTATTDTVGLGQSYLSRDPTYDMTFSFDPRYYIYDQSSADVATLGTSAAVNAATKTTISLRADVGASREFTNSDVTTERGEWTMTDAEVLMALVTQLYSHKDYLTLVAIKAPRLTLPTSRFSYDSGRYLDVGASAAVIQQLPLLGSSSDFMQILSLAAVVGYDHWFTNATQATNSSLHRVRMNPQGVSVPGDQLTGSAFIAHEAYLTLEGEIAISDRFSLDSAFTWEPYWKYTFDNSRCTTITTGCAVPTGIDSPNNFSVITEFTTELDVRVFDELALGIGYDNLTQQLGPDGKRRNMLYSPDARVYLTMTAYLDQIYKAVRKATASPEQTARLAGGSITE